MKTIVIAIGSKLGIAPTKKIPGEGFKTPLVAAHQDGCSGEGEGGKAFQPAAADVRKLKLKGLKARKIIAQGKRSETSAALGNESK